MSYHLVVIAVPAVNAHPKNPRREQVDQGARTKC